MANRYLAIVDPTPELIAAIARRDDLGLIRSLDSDGLLVLTDPQTRVTELSDTLGLIVGPIYDRGMRNALTAIDIEASTKIVGTRGQALVNRYWGGYIGLFPGRGDDGAFVIRAPLGDLPCLYRRLGSSLIVASDLSLMRRIDPRPTSIDRDELGRHLIAPDVRRSRTCLSGIDELQGGDRLEFAAGRIGVETLWSPWQFVQTSSGPRDPSDLAPRLRDAIDLAVTARSSSYRRVLMRLSGGLDSSIVTASLAAAGRDIVALTMITEHAASDERYYGRLVADAYSIELVETPRSLGSIDPTVSLSSGQPRPVTRLFMQDSVAAARQIAAEQAADVIFDGGGGDNVFCYLRSVAPIIDRYKETGWRSIRDGVWDIASLTRTPVPTVLRRTVQRALRRSPRYNWPPKTDFLSQPTIELTGSALSHRWFDTPPGALPGKSAQVALLVSAQSWIESLDPTTARASISPLLAQPVVEAALAVPSWMWSEGGRNRAVARDAFRGRLPDTIIDRHSKAGPDGFLAQIYGAHRPTIRDMLLHGRLADLGLLDLDAISAATDPSTIIKGYDFLRILQLLDVESWAGSVR